jgi:hypothetical protein
MNFKMFLRRRSAARALSVIMPGLLILLPARVQAQHAQADWSPQDRRFGNLYSATDSQKQIALDPATGDIYITGQSKYSGQQTAITTWKYNSAGVLQWTKKWTSGTAGAPSAHYGVAVAFRELPTSPPTKIVAVTGVAAGPNGLDWITILYDELGSYRWGTTTPVRYHDGAAHGDDRPVAVGIDAAGNAYVTGSVVGSGTGIDIDVVQYPFNPLGTGWTFSWSNISAAQEDRPLDMEVYDPPVTPALLTLPQGPAGVYVTGHSYSLSTGNDMVTFGISLSGALAWKQEYQGPGTDVGTSLKVFQINDPSQPASTVHVFVTGYSFNELTETTDYITTAYDALNLGEPVWTAQADNVDVVVTNVRVRPSSGHHVRRAVLPIAAARRRRVEPCRVSELA